MSHDMSNKNIRRFIWFVVLFISINTTNGIIINIPTLTSRNQSVFNRTTTIYPWKRSNSIELLKKLIANRQIITKYNRTLFLTSKVYP